MGLGHASVLIETAAGSVLTDPWVNPAYFGSWFPFPDNSQLDWDALGDVDYLFVSHLHKDHFDPEHLRKHVNKRARVLLPEYPTSELEDALRGCGFTSFVKTSTGEVVDLDGLQVMIQALTAPTDGPIGDSSLWLSDGTATVLNQNDARPSNLDAFRALGQVDAYLLQFSGAIWFPMVYEISDQAKQKFGADKRERQYDRSLRYIEELEARFVFPTAGPPCFLDPDLFSLNDVADEPWNIFPDQAKYLAYLKDHGHTEGRLLLPGSVASLHQDDCPVTHPYDPVTIFGSNEAKTVYLLDMQQRRMPEVEALRATWAHPEIDVLASLKEWFTPLLAESTRIAAGIDGGVQIICEDAVRGDIDVLINFIGREVRAYDGEKVRYRFRTQRSYVEQLIADHEIDWSNSLFLSCRFSAHRIGPFNEFVYVFFKCLSEERLQYAEGWFTEKDDTEATETITLGDHDVQRRCPHLKADLSRFARIEDDILTCQMHGWKRRLSDGKCLTSVGHDLRCAPAGAPLPSATQAPMPGDATPHDAHQGHHEAEQEQDSG